MKMLSSQTDSRSADYVRNLVQGGFLCSHGYGKGFPILRQAGLQVLRRVTKLFVDLMSNGAACLATQPRLLVPSSQYRREVDAFGGFDNCFEVAIGDKPFVLRPDAALENLSLLSGFTLDGGTSQACAVFQGFRSVSGATLPLFRDRFIYPFVQFNKLVPRASLDLEMAGVVDALCRFFDTLCLPVRIVDFGPWKGYAKRLCVAVAHLPDGTPTVVSMAYVVGDTYRRLAGVPEASEALDIGITQKVFSLMAMRHADENGVRLPSAVAPVQLVLSKQAAQQLRAEVDLRSLGLREQVVADQRSSTVRRWARAGAVLQLYSGRRELRLFSRSAGWRPVSTAHDFVTALRDEDAALLAGTSSADLQQADPPIWTAADAAGATGQVVGFSSSFRNGVQGLSVPAPWTGPRVFY